MNILSNGGPEHFKMMLTLQAYENAEHQQQQMAMHFWPVIGTANQVAFLAMDDAFNAMNEAGMLKQRIKYVAKRSMDEYKKYEDICHRHFTEICDERFPFWQDLICRAANSLQPDVHKLRFAIKNVIDKYKVNNSNALSHIHTALALITISNMLYDTMANKFQAQSILPIEQSFRAGRLTSVYSLWNEIGLLTGKTETGTVDLSNDPGCSLGVQVILKRYEDADFIQLAAAEALHMNPSTWKYASKEDQDRLKEGSL